jgi:CheY-like chemotaxis protein
LSFRRVLRVSLAAVGFSVEEAGSGEEALALLAAGRYDVVLLDIEMPGWAESKPVKKSRAYPRDQQS